MTFFSRDEVSTKIEHKEYKDVKNLKINYEFKKKYFFPFILHNCLQKATVQVNICLVSHTRRIYLVFPPGIVQTVVFRNSFSSNYKKN